MMPRALPLSLTALYVALSTVPGVAEPLHDLNDPAHWYDPACCHQQDCAPIPESRVSATPEGYALSLRPGDHPLVRRPLEHVEAYNEVRPSRDGDWHACVMHQSVICVYGPMSF